MLSKKPENDWEQVIFKLLVACQRILGLAILARYKMHTLREEKKELRFHQLKVKSFGSAQSLCRALAAPQERLLTQEFNQVCVFLSSILGCPNCCLQTGHQTMDKVQPFHTLTSIRLARQFQSKPQYGLLNKKVCLLLIFARRRHILAFLKGNLLII